MSVFRSIWTGHNHGLDTVTPGTTLGPRRRPFYEMLWFQVGGGSLHLDGQMITAAEGDMVLAPPARREFCRWEAHRTSRIAYIHFEFDTIPKDWPPPARWPTSRQLAPNDLAVPLFQFIQTHAPMYNGRPHPSTLEPAAAALLAAHIVGPADIRPPSNVTPPQPVYRTLQWIAEVMQSDPAFPITLRDLSDAAGVTPQHLCRLFNQSLKCSPVEAVWIYRLTLSLLHLREPYRKIGDIAQSLGFSNPFHYSKRFRDHFGEPPRTVRQKMIADGYQPPLPPWPFM